MWNKISQTNIQKVYTKLPNVIVPRDVILQVCYSTSVKFLVRFKHGFR